MGAPYWKLEWKIEDALKALITTLDDPGARISVDVGFSADTATEPCVRVFCRSSEPAIPDEALPPIGNRYVNVELRIQSHAGPDADGVVSRSTARDDHADLVARVLDLFYRDDITTQIAAMGVADLHVQSVEIGTLNRAVEDHSFVTTQELRLLAFPS